MFCPALKSGVLHWAPLLQGFTHRKVIFHFCGILETGLLTAQEEIFDISVGGKSSMRNNQNRNRTGGGGGGGGGNPQQQQHQGPKKDLRLFVSGTMSSLIVRVKYYLNGQGQTHEFPLCFGPASDPCAYSIPDPSKTGGEVYTLSVVDGEGVVAGIDLSAYKKEALKKVGVKLGADEFVADLPEEQPAGSAAGQVPPTAEKPKAAKSSDPVYALYTRFVPVSGTEDAWSLEGQTFEDGVGCKADVVFSGTRIATSEQGTFSSRFQVNGEETVYVHRADMLDLNVAAVLHGHAHEHGGHAGHAGHHGHHAEQGFYAWCGEKWRRNNNKLLGLIFWLGVWSSLYMSYGLLSLLFNPRGTQEETVVENSASPREKQDARRKALESQLGSFSEEPDSLPALKPEAKKTGKPSLLSEAVAIVIPFRAIHEGRPLARVGFWLLYWILFWIFWVPVCLADEVGQASAAAKGRFAHKREAVELVAERRKYEGVYVVYRKKNGENVGEKPPVEEHAEHKPHARPAPLGRESWREFIEKDIMVEVAMNLVGHVLTRYFPFLKPLF
ncbi:MAG: hypothetical protein JNN11_01260 [Candidatus Doudnabacteria bacterium]|nr:hypothetical protein [Candidatus Doudnabacteria bacterium]